MHCILFPFDPGNIRNMPGKYLTYVRNGHIKEINEHNFVIRPCVTL